VDLFEENSRAMKRVERLKVEIARKLEGKGVYHPLAQCYLGTRVAILYSKY